MKITHKGKTPWEGHEATCFACGTKAILEAADARVFQRAMPGKVRYQFRCPVCGEPELTVTIPFSPD